MKEGKAFHISQNEVLYAYKAVKANKGAGGVDGVELEEFDKNWKDRLYVLWNRMVSGSYFPKSVKGVEIPKKNGKKRLLGIPTIEDRVAQMVLRNRLEPLVEPFFCNDSYGYRPGKSALDAVKTARERCFRMKWVIEFDIVGLFDNIDHEKLMTLVEMHCKEKWILLYIKRCLTAPIQMPDGETRARNAGTPQGGVISPVLANLFMHYSFDMWMNRKFPNCPWERYADDGVIHCVSRKQAEFVLDMLRERMEKVGLKIHPDKSKIVFCQRNNESAPEGVEKSFVFLGYSFRPRLVKSKQGIFFMGFAPAVSTEAGKIFREKIRKSVKQQNTTDIISLSNRLNPIIRGWMNYFTRFAPSEAFKLGINYVNMELTRWIRKTRKKARRSYRKAQKLLHQIAMSNTNLFYHWEVGYMPVH
ncbi:MAG: group II intron reverse transcriptase/maturase [Lachnospiraceae bacterium]|nr:group II intron reverse transcriptase/maturase [Lachnospiraceae bacterium]